MRDPLAGTSIKYKLTASFVGICLAAFGVGGYMVSTFARDTLEHEILRRLEAEARGMAAQLDASIDLLGRRADDFASDGFVRGELEQLLAARSNGFPRRSPDTAALAAHLRDNKLPLIPALAGIALCDTTGAPLVRITCDGDADARDLPVIAGVHAMQAYYAAGAGDGAPRIAGFMLCTPVRALRSRRVIGMLVFHVDAARWMRQEERIMRTPPSADGTTPVRLLRDARGAVLPLCASDRVSDTASAERCVWQHPLTASEWTVQVSLDPAPAMAAVSGLQSGFLGAGVLFAAAALVLMFFPIRFLVRPLGVLRDAARRMSHGDYSVRVPETADDEIGDLAHAFNTMAAATQERTVSLEHTAALLDRRSRELRIERDLLESIMRAMHDGVLSLDRHGAVLLHNDAAAPLAGVLREKRDAIHPWHCKGQKERQADGTAPCATRSCLDCLGRPDAAPLTCTIEHEGRILEILSTPVGERGTVHGRILVSRDVTERVRISALEAHRERLAIVGEIAASMAHELNNPLAAISIYAQMMRDELAGDALHREHVEVILRNTEVCSRAVRSLLDHARRADGDVAELDLVALAADVALLVAPLAARAGVHVHVDDDAEAADTRDCIVRTDAALVRQVLVNLMLNAVQALESAGGDVAIDVRAHGTDAVALRVIDSGEGPPPEWRERIFEPFFTTKQAGKGTGLGLPTARRIAEALGGSLELEASGNGHTVFCLALPREAHA